MLEAKYLGETKHWSGKNALHAIVAEKIQLPY